MLQLAPALYDEGLFRDANEGTVHAVIFPAIATMAKPDVI